MFARSFKPAGDGGFTMTGTAYENRDIAAFGQEHQDQHDVPFIGLHPIQGRVKATGEARFTPLAFPVLNVFVNTTFSITNDRVQQVIDDAEVLTPGIGTGMALSIELFGTTTCAFALVVGNDTRFRLQHGQFDPRLAIWAVLRRSGFQFSGKSALDLLAKFLDTFFESLPQQKKHGEMER